jgi:hypothetical protein
MEVSHQQQKRGIFLLKASFPEMTFLFLASKLKPPAAVFATRINFDNYDLEPLSVRFLDPITWEESVNPSLPFLRKIVSTNDNPAYQSLIQKDETGLPFLCFPGIREYQLHPAHTGDQWLLHRQSGEGSLGFILDKLHDYGLAPITNYQFSTQMKIQTPILNAGIDPSLIPE